MQRLESHLPGHHPRWRWFGRRFLRVLRPIDLLRPNPRVRRPPRFDRRVLQPRLFGRRVHYPEVNTKNASMRNFLERAAINAPIQGSAADIIRRAMIRMPGAMRDARLEATTMLLQVHDELIFEAKEAEVPKAIEVARKVMETAALPAVQFTVPIHVDAKAADNWEAAH